MIKKSPSILSLVFALGLGVLALMWSAFVLREVWSSDSKPLDFRLAGTTRITAPTSLRSDGRTKPVAVGDYDTGPENTRVDLTVTVLKLIPSEGKLLADLELEAPGSLKERIEPKLSDTVTCEENNLGKRPHLRLKEPYQDKNLHVNVLNEIGTEHVKTRIPFETFLASSIDPDVNTCEEGNAALTTRPTKIRIPIELPVVTGPVQSYPSNWHQLSANVRVKLPRGFTLPEDVPQDASDSASVPPTLSDQIMIASSLGMEDKTIVVTPEDEQPLQRSIAKPRAAAITATEEPGVPTQQFNDLEQEELDLKLMLVKDWSTQTFTYLAALLPFLLLSPILLSAIIMLSDSDHTSELTNVVISVVIAMLAVLPLRQVLIPSDVSGLTRIDYILAIQLVTLSAIALFLYGVRLWRHPSGSGKGDEEDNNNTILGLGMTNNQNE